MSNARDWVITVKTKRPHAKGHHEFIYGEFHNGCDTARMIKKSVIEMYPNSKVTLKVLG